ncbi:MAG TPA: hypothetical protein VFD80_09920 [Flavobacteriaceae bacterium]|nr:hypothetical protein [Flavobacteriaceae bacterium]
MKRLTYILGICILVGVLLVSFVFIKMYNKPHIDMVNAQPQFVVSVIELANEFQTDENEANQKYLDNVLQVKGEVAAISTNNGKSVLTLRQEGSSTQVICTLNASENKKVLQLKEGQQVTVKGICTGFLLDIMLVRTIIVN